MEKMRLWTMNAETTLYTPFTEYKSIKFKHFDHVNRHGNFQLPDFMYEGVVICLSDQNIHELRVIKCFKLFLLFLIHFL